MDNIDILLCMKLPAPMEYKWSHNIMIREYKYINHKLPPTPSFYGTLQYVSI